MKSLCRIPFAAPFARISGWHFRKSSLGTAHILATRDSIRYTCLWAYVPEIVAEGEDKPGLGIFCRDSGILGHEQDLTPDYS